MDTFRTTMHFLTKETGRMVANMAVKTQTTSLLQTVDDCIISMIVERVEIEHFCYFCAALRAA